MTRLDRFPVTDRQLIMWVFVAVCAIYFAIVVGATGLDGIVRRWPVHAVLVGFYGICCFRGCRS